MGALSTRIAAGTVAVIAFELPWLERLSSWVPELITGHISRFGLFPSQRTALLGPWAPLLRLNPSYVRVAKRRGQIVCPLDPRLNINLHRHLSLGVDALLTNDPEDTRERVQRWRSELSTR